MKKVLLFTVFRYLEFGITSLLYFSLASSVDPAEYGLSSRSFILITLSAFFALGTNQSIVKWVSKQNEDSERKCLILYGFILNTIASFAAFVVVSTLVEAEYWFWTGLIASGKLILEYFCTINRVHEKWASINIIYLSVAIPFAVAYYLFSMGSVETFFMFWAVFVWVGVVVAILMSTPIIFAYIAVPASLFLYLKKNICGLLLDGLKLAAIGMLVPVLGTSDKLFLSYTSFDSSILGSMQLADNVAMVVIYAIGAVVYAITPSFIKKVHSGEMNMPIFYLNGYRVLVLVVIVLLIFSKFLELVLGYIFPNYDLGYYLTIYLLVRCLISGLFMFNISVMAFSRESFYLSIIICALLLHFVCLYFVFSLLKDEALIATFFPFVGIFTMIFLHSRSYIYAKRHFFGV